MVLDQFTCGHLVMADNTTTAIVMATLHQCGQYPLIQLWMTARLLFTMRAVRPLLPPLLATAESGSRDLAWWELTYYPIFIFRNNLKITAHRLLSCVYPCPVVHSRDLYHRSDRRNASQELPSDTETYVLRYLTDRLLMLASIREICIIDWP